LANDRRGERDDDGASGSPNRHSHPDTPSDMIEDSPMTSGTQPTLPRLVRYDDHADETSSAPSPVPPTTRTSTPTSGFGEDRARVVRELFHQHHGRVLAFLRRLTDGERAEDLAQEVFFRLFSVKNLESREISVSYLFRIGENLVRKAYHREVRHRRAGEDLRNRSDAGIDRGSDSADRGASEMGFVSRATLHEALSTLTDNEQAAIRLIVCRGLSYEQAARSLGVNVSTINNWKHRGVRKLKQIIGEARPARATDFSPPPRTDARRGAGRGAGVQARIRARIIEIASRIDERADSRSRRAATPVSSSAASDETSVLGMTD